MSLFTNLYAMIEGQFGALTPLMLLGAVGMVLIMAVLPFLLVKTAEPFEKVKSQREGRSRDGAEPSVASKQLRREEKTDKLQKFATFLEPQNSGELNEARLQMMRAGYRSKNAVRMYHFLQLVLGVGAMALGGLYVLTLSISSGAMPPNAVAYVAGAGAVGFYLPKYLLMRAIQARKAQIVDGFPDAMDLMLVSVEAGQSLDQSINRIAKEARVSYPALADELDIVSQEVKAGKERVGVLKDMAHRIDVPDITSFVSTLVQSATFGTSMADSLRMYSVEMRDKRAMRAEEAANKIPTKLTLATMMFTLPPLMTILMGPAIYQLVSS